MYHDASNSLGVCGHKPSTWQGRAQGKRRDPVIGGMNHYAGRENSSSNLRSFGPLNIEKETKATADTGNGKPRRTAASAPTENIKCM